MSERARSCGGGGGGVTITRTAISASLLWTGIALVSTPLPSPHPLCPTVHTLQNLIVHWSRLLLAFCGFFLFRLMDSSQPSKKCTHFMCMLVSTWHIT